MSSGSGAPPVDVVVPWRAGRDGERRYLPGDPPRWLDAFARMDSEYYLAIAAFGYARDAGGALPQRAGFFPGYPAVVRGATHVANVARGKPGAPLLDEPVALLASAFVISNLALWLAALMLERLGRAVFDPAIAEGAALWLVACPVAFFGSAYLAESLFLLLSIAATSCALKGRIVVAAVLGAAAAFTRPVGVLLVAPLLLFAWTRRRERLGFARALFVLIAVPAGFGAVMVVHERTLGDPWAWFTVQRAYGHGGFPDVAGVADLFRVAGKTTLERVRDTVQIASVGVAVACVAALAFSRRSPLALTGLAVLLVLFVLLSGHVISLPRYLFATFPLFFGAALLLGEGPSARVARWASVGLQVAGFVVFTRAWPVLI